MELNEFVNQVIISVIKGVNESQALLKNTNAIVNPSTIKDGYLSGTNRKVIDVNFDVAVTTSEEGNNNKGVKISVFETFSGGVGKETKTANQTVSRVSFSVPVVLPTSDNLSEEAMKKQITALKNFSL